MRRNEETERNRDAEGNVGPVGNEESRDNDEVDSPARPREGEELQRTEKTGSTVDTGICEDTQRVQETRRSVEMERSEETIQTIEDEPMRTEEPVELENPDPEEPMDMRESDPRGSTRRPKRLCSYQDPREPEQLVRLERDDSVPEVDHRREGAETLLEMAGMIIEPIQPTMMYRRDRNEEERKDEEAQVDETEASLEANYGETSHREYQRQLRAPRHRRDGKDTHCTRYIENRRGTDVEAEH